MNREPTEGLWASPQGDVLQIKLTGDTDGRADEIARAASNQGYAIRYFEDPKQAWDWLKN